MPPRCSRRSASKVLDPRHHPRPAGASSAFLTAITSLSPRPDRSINRSHRGPLSARVGQACATACDDSSAGKMPSSRARRRNAASASSSISRCTPGARARAQPRMLRAATRRVIETSGKSNASARCCRRRPEDIAAGALRYAAAATGKPGRCSGRGGRDIRRLRRNESRTARSAMNASKMPMALLPRPTRATMTSGQTAVDSTTLPTGLLPITDWNSRTMSG